MSSDETPRLGLPDMPETPELYPDIVADAFARIDAFTDLYLKGQFVNTPPSAPADGDAYLTGGSPTGAWAGYPYKIASCRDGAWTMLAPFNGLRAYVATTGALIVYADGAWTDWNSMIGAGENSIASAATCDIGAAGSLFLAVTGTTTITSFGAAANKLRFLRFAGALTLTHNATSLILPGAANLVTAAGDTAILASDGSGNWRCRHYSRADGRMTNMAGPTFTGTLAAAAANFSGSVSVAANTNSDTFTLRSNQSAPAADAFIYRPADNTLGLGTGSSVRLTLSNSLATFATALNYGGVTLANSVTGTGSMVLNGNPAFTGNATTFSNGAGASGSRVVIENPASSGGSFIQFYQDLVPSSAFATGTAVPGGSKADAFVFSRYAGSWGEMGRFGADGSFLKGTTTNGGWTGGAIAEFRSANNYGLSVYSTGSSNSAATFRVDNTGANYVTFWYGASTTVGSITTNATATAFNTSSDMRLKTVLTEQRDWRAAICGLWVGEFDKYSDFTKTGPANRDFGVLAQQAHEALGGLGITVPASENGVWMASAEPFAFLALWGVKDVYALLAALTDRVAALEAAHAG